MFSHVDWLTFSLVDWLPRQGQGQGQEQAGDEELVLSAQQELMRERLEKPLLNTQFEQLVKNGQLAFNEDGSPTLLPRQTPATDGAGSVEQPSGAAGGTGVGVVLISQMEEGRLLRCDVGPDGVLKAQFDTATFEPPSAADGSGLPFVGLHGLACASAPGKAWVTLQYLNQVCLIDVKTMKVEVSIKCPRSLADGRGPIGGPHCARECHGHLYVCMKGGASICHASGEEAGMAQEAGAHALWRVALNERLEPVDDGIVFETPPTPVMCDVTPEGCDRLLLVSYGPSQSDSAEYRYANGQLRPSLIDSGLPSRQ